jgi:hypothetical protein
METKMDRQGRSHIKPGVQVLPSGKLKTNRIKSNRSIKSHPEKILCYPLESGLWIGLWFIKNACWNFFYTDKLMGFNPLRYSIRLSLHPGKISGSAPVDRDLLRNLLCIVLLLFNLNSLIWIITHLNWIVVILYDEILILKN